MNNYSENDFRNYQELYHHGILGQRWGVKNGPPYPLRDGSHSASERKANSRPLSRTDVMQIRASVTPAIHPARLGNQITQNKRPLYKRITECGTSIKDKAGNAQKAAYAFYNRPKGSTREQQKTLGEASAKAERNYSKALSKEVDKLLSDGNFGPQDRLAVRKAISSVANYQAMMDTWDIKSGDVKNTDIGHWACNLVYQMTQVENNK